MKMRAMAHSSMGGDAREERLEASHVVDAGYSHQAALFIGGPVDGTVAAAKIGIAIVRCSEYRGAGIGLWTCHRFESVQPKRAHDFYLWRSDGKLAGEPFCKFCCVWAQILQQTR
jgi:hypothetical protein